MRIQYIVLLSLLHFPIDEKHSFLHRVHFVANCILDITKNYEINEPYENPVMKRSSFA